MTSCPPQVPDGGTVQGLLPGGSWNWVGALWITCDPGQTPSSDGRGNYWCIPTAFSQAVNNGEPRRCADCELSSRMTGNPIQGAVGNKFETEVDYVGAGPFPLTFTRYHNSQGGDDPYATLGPNWSHSYSARLRFGSTPGGAVNTNQVVALRADGKRIPWNASGGVYVTDEPFRDHRLTKTASGYTLATPDDVTETYDTTGRLVSIQDRIGLLITLSYTGGDLSTVTDGFGRSLTFTRSGIDRRITAVTLPDGSKLQYAYTTGSDTLLSVRYPDNAVRTYRYENGTFPKKLTGVTDELGVKLSTFTYAGSGYANTTAHAGNADKFTLVPDTTNATTRSISVTRYLDGVQTSTNTYAYQSVRGVALNTAISGDACPECGAKSRTFDAYGNLTAAVDWNGNRTTFTYDTTRGLETSRTEGLTNAGAATPATRKITKTWHASWRVPTVITEPLRRTTFVYNGDGGAVCGVRADGLTPVPGVLCQKTVQATTDPTGTQGAAATTTGPARSWSYTYDENGQRLSEDGPRTDVADVTSYAYYPADATCSGPSPTGCRGMLASITNALGQVTQVLQYDAHGRPLVTQDVNGLVTSLAYDARQRLISRTFDGETTTYGYDAAGLLTQITQPDGSFLAYAYDAAHRLTAITDNQGNRVAYTLDFAGNRVQEQVFDPTNQLTQTQTRVFNNLNRLFQEIGATGQTTQYGYDNQGNPISVTDPLGRVTGRSYDELNRLVKITDPAGGETLRGYDALDRLISVADPRSVTTGYGYDGLSNAVQVTSPEGGVTARTFDLAGNVATQTDGKGQMTAYAYDALNRITAMTFQDGASRQYGYDDGPNGVGRLTSITDPAGTIALAYDASGRVVKETRALGGITLVTQQSYDTHGRLVGLTYPSGRTVSYTLDALGRVGKVTTTQAGVTEVVADSVQYHPFGGLRSLVLGNGLVYERGQDQDGRVSAYTLAGTQHALSYDAAGQLVGIVPGGDPGGTVSFAYDDLARLTQATFASGSYGYSYDKAGNRLTRSSGPSTDVYAYEAASNRLSSLTPTSGAVRSYVHDANGALVSDGLSSWTYDSRGRLVQATSGQGSTTYVIDALGQRIRKSSALDDVLYQYDRDGRLIAEFDGGGGLLKEYIYLGEVLVGVVVVS